MSGEPPAPEIRSLEPALTWLGESFVPGLRIDITAEGTIAGVGPAEQTPEQPATEATLRLPGHAVLPGFVNAHSHAFQRGLRGQGETFPVGAGSFWTWREAMYELVDGLDYETLVALSRRAFAEMRAAGITAVGEFHYVHHQDPSALDGAFDLAVLDAARHVGIRVVLLQTYYRTGGFGRPLTGGQRRFGCPSPAAYWQRMDALAERLDPRTQSLGAVAHSLRAAPLEDLCALHSEARRRDLPFHMHVEEQRQEIDECRKVYGASPMELILRELDLEPGGRTGFTAVHCTHTPAEQLEQFAERGGIPCICPLTEANLGDGIPALRRSPAAASRLCLGTDSNARISMLEEMRWLEYGQRLAGECRGALADAGGRVAPRLLGSATAGGARALGLAAGTLAPGRFADLARVDLSHPSLAGATAETLPEALVFGAADGTIDGTWVGGRWSSSTQPQETG